MARKTPKARRTPVTPRTTARSQAGSGQATARVEPALASEEVATTYAYVRRDLARIAILAACLFGLIVGARFVL
jgi:hypothetical protein